MVVRDVHAAAAADDLLLGLHLGDAVMDEARAVVARDVGELVLPGVAEVERLDHLHRAVGERRLGRDQGDRDALAGQVAQRHQGLERGDAAAGDHHVGGGRLGHAPTLSPARSGSIGPNCESRRR
jgi:hypothetical protein